MINSKKKPVKNLKSYHFNNSLYKVYLLYFFLLFWINWGVCLENFVNVLRYFGEGDVGRAHLPRIRWGGKAGRREAKELGRKIFLVFFWYLHQGLEVVGGRGLLYRQAFLKMNGKGTSKTSHPQLQGFPLFPSNRVNPDHLIFHHLFMCFCLYS